MTTDKMQIEQGIFNFVIQKSHYDINRITSESLLFMEGIFDSMGFILLIDFLENTFDIKANENELVEKNFESVAAITDYVIRKKNARAA
jgi:acyl carrier protein